MFCCTPILAQNSIIIRDSNNNNKNRKYWTFESLLLHLERTSIFHISFRLFFMEARQWSLHLLYSFFFLFPDIYSLKFWVFSFHENLLKWLDLCLWTIYDVISYFTILKWIFAETIFGLLFFAYAMQISLSRWINRRIFFFILIAV